ncbi:MAG: flavin reductase [Thermoguttaceae bacterium]|nr:flavin reductase [Planctomycetaceae bacterium]MBQ4141981.1 flavin reductase [Thermoguttaceae bacterium]
MDPSVLFKIGYGLYVLSAEENRKDNACIVNTLVQVTSSPCRVAVTVNKQNLTHDMILRTGKFNAAILSENAAFLTFQRFGFQSGRNAEKFYGASAVERTANGILVWKEGVNAFLSGKVVSTVDLGTHTLFLADVTDGRILDTQTPSATYTFYHEHIKPRPEEIQPAAEGKVRFRCKICGYIHETKSDSLPEDFVCPLCKHGPEDFERIGQN